MANIPIRKTLESLIKKVEELENQSFAQKLHIDELESKLARTEETLKYVQKNPFGIPTVTVPSVWPATPQNPYAHVCVAGLPDWTGVAYCTTCGTYMSGQSWIVTSTSDSTSFNLADPLAQSSSNVEPVLDLDISWEVPDDFPNKKD
jgi:hypothetical protein